MRKKKTTARPKNPEVKVIVETIDKCKHPDCYYRGGNGETKTCDFCFIEGVPRVCLISQCTKYKPGRGKGKRKRITDI